MTRTVDLVIEGARPAARTAAIDAARRGLRVIVVIRSRRARFAARFRKSLRTAGARLDGQVRIMTGAEVVCVDGIRAVEAVVIRRIRTGQLIGVNTSDVRVEACRAGSPGTFSPCCSSDGGSLGVDSRHQGL